MSERKPLTPEQREAKNRKAREKRAAAKAVDFQEAEVKVVAVTQQEGVDPEALKAPEDFASRYSAQEPTEVPCPDVPAQEDGKGLDLPQVKAAAESLMSHGIPTDPRVKVQAPKEPRYLASQDNTVYTNPKHPENKGEFKKVGVLYRHKDLEGKMRQDILAMGREPANKKERRKAKAGLPFRDKTGVVA